VWFFGILFSSCLAVFLCLAFLNIYWLWKKKITCAFTISLDLPNIMWFTGFIIGICKFQRRRRLVDISKQKNKRLACSSLRHYNTVEFIRVSYHIEVMCTWYCHANGTRKAKLRGRPHLKTKWRRKKNCLYTFHLYCVIDFYFD